MFLFMGMKDREEVRVRNERTQLPQNNYQMKLTTNIVSVH
jgi:hypothetical protein